MYLQYIIVQKIQQNTILKNWFNEAPYVVLFKKYNKIQSLRTPATATNKKISSKNTTKYNP